MARSLSEFFCLNIHCFNVQQYGHPILRKKGSSTVVRELSQQINMFWRDEYPRAFRVLDRENFDDPLRWWHWQDLAKHNWGECYHLQ